MQAFLYLQMLALYLDRMILLRSGVGTEPVPVVGLGLGLVGSHGRLGSATPVVARFSAVNWFRTFEKRKR